MLLMVNSQRKIAIYHNFSLSIEDLGFDIGSSSFLSIWPKSSLAAPEVTSLEVVGTSSARSCNYKLLFFHFIIVVCDL